MRGGDGEDSAGYAVMAIPPAALTRVPVPSTIRSSYRSFRVGAQPTGRFTVSTTGSDSSACLPTYPTLTHTFHA